MFSSTKKKFGLTLGALLSVSLLVYACGGGGSSSSGPTPSAGTTGSKSAATSASATQAALQVTSIGVNGGLSGKPSLNLKKGSLTGKTKAWEEMFKSKAAGKAHHALTNGPVTTPCAGGGSLTRNVTYVAPTFTMTETASSCVENITFQTTNFGSTVKNGSLTVTQVDHTYAGTDPSTDPAAPIPNDDGDPAWDPTSTTVASNSGYSFTFKGPDGNVEDMFKITGTVTVTEVQDSLTKNPTSGALTASNLVLEAQSDNGTPIDSTDDNHDVFTLTNFDEIMTFTAWDAKNIPTHSIDTTNGAVAIDDQINNANDVNITFTNFKVDETVTQNTGADTYTVLVDGQLSTPCLGGAITVATTTPIVIVGDACPTEGVITVTDSASKVATVTFTSSGGVHVANPDATTQDFAKCDDAHAC